MDRFFGFSRYNQGQQDISGLGGRRQVTRVVRRVYVSNDSPNQLPTFDPFLTTHFPQMHATMEQPMITRHRQLCADDSPPLPPSEPDSTMISNHTRYYNDAFPSSFPSKAVEQPKAAPRYYPDAYYNPPPKANPPMMTGGYYGDEFSNYPPRHGPPPGGNPVNLHVNLHLRPDELRQLYPGNVGYNGQNGGNGYNPQVQGGNKVGGDGKITLGPDINGGNINIGSGKAGGGNVGGKKKNKDDDSSDDEDNKAK